MTWGFLWLMLVLKIPIIGLFWIVWWAVHQDEPPAEEGGGDGGGGTKVHPAGNRPWPPSFPRRRGPHGGRGPTAPERVRSAPVRGRTPERP